jgi:membrane protease subunit (stomatin/prohibitin family)
MVGQRTRVALEREKALVLRSIKELEFDKAMGKLSDGDWQEMSGRLRARASRLIRQLDAGGSYRAQVEQELVKRVGEAPQVVARAFCAACGTRRDPDAKFCKNCGTQL